MKENMLDVLMYLFENYMIEDAQFQSGRDDMEDELVRMGFTDTEIIKAFSWLEGLSDLCDSEVESGEQKPLKAYRHYTNLERCKINIEIQGLLLSLEQSGVIKSHAREIIIDRIMALDIDDTDSDNAKWVIMMVLCNTDASDGTLELAEDLMFFGLSAEKH